MIAELVFVGTELLLGQIVNTNAQHISLKLSQLGIDNYFQVTVGDNWNRLAGVLRQALDRSDVVITSGGLGPTMDDITREVSAEVTGRPLELDEQIVQGIVTRFGRLGRPMTENNKRQAMVPQGATVLPNPNGTAPGLIIPALGDRKSIVLLPGPPNELIPMFDNHVIPYLTARMGGTPLSLVSLTLRFTDIGESALEDALKDLIAGQTDPTIAPYAKLGEVHLRVSTKAQTREEGLRRMEPVLAEIRARVGQHIYGHDETPLEAAVGELLRQKGMTLAVAESCTGGLLAKRLTDIAGSSDYFAAGWVTYSNDAKVRDLGVSPETLFRHGAVSEPAAAEMAQGARERSGAAVALSITGVAGPGGGTKEKPVGMVCIGLASPEGSEARTFQWWGSRADVRWRSSQTALAMLRRYLLGRR